MNPASQLSRRCSRTRADEFNRILLERGWEVDVVSLGPLSEYPLFRSKLQLLAMSEVAFDSYDVYWHMLRDPTQPEVLKLLENLKLDYAGKPVINHVDRLRYHDKHRYSKVLLEARDGTWRYCPRPLTGLIGLPKKVAV